MKKTLILSTILGLAFPLQLRAEITAANASVKVPERKVRTVAVVNNEPIFSDELEREAEPFVLRFEQTAPKDQRTPERLTALKKEVLNRLIEEKLILQQAKKQQIRINKAEVERGIDQFKEPFAVDAQGQARSAAEAEKAFQDQLEKEQLTKKEFTQRVEEQLMKMRLIEQEVRSKVSLPDDSEGKKLFAKVQQKMSGKEVAGVGKEEDASLDQMAKFIKRMGTTQVHIRHILMRTAQDATPDEKLAARKRLQDVQAKLKKGEDFSILAGKYSEDPISRNRGGDLGFVAEGDLGLKGMDNFVFKAEEGQVSDVVESEVGFHLIKVVEKKAPHKVEYDEVSEDLKGYLAQKNFTEKLELYLKQLKEKASIKIN